MITYLDMERVKEFFLTLNGEKLLEVFGVQLGEHLSHKFFEVYERDFMAFYCSLDKECAMKLIEAINKTKL